ncbi:hypothetical protein QYE76_026378 [Lolium multiflorum]|uniref:Uncharacterized protein n=1 Tax=Lolium multiflorum TaxID=4521 RepID=A0AAD8RHM0_LOLMU|nr:hypothetical protein QYE76_026378 [Lolium multiflorum]
MSSGEYVSDSSSGNHHSETPSVSSGEDISVDRASDGLEAELAQSKAGTGSSTQATGNQGEAGSSSQGAGINLDAYTRGAWMGSDVTQAEIDWLYRSRRIPEEVWYRIPGDERQPMPEPVDNFSFFYYLRKNSIQDKNLPHPKPFVRCGGCILSPHQGSPFFKLSGLESVRTWQKSFFYVRNGGPEDFINLPEYVPGPPSMKNWLHNPKDDKESLRIGLFVEKNKEETNLSAKDLVMAFLSRRVLPLQRRAHKICQMSGRMDPTRITTYRLSAPDLVLKARKICQNPLRPSGKFGLAPYCRSNPPPRQNFRRIRPRPGNPNPEVVEHAAPLQAEVGPEFLDNLASWGRKKKAPASEAGTSDAPPAKRSRKEVVGGKQVTTKHYRKREMPVASGPALKISKSATGMRPEGSEDAARASPLPQPSPVPSEAEDTGASNIGAGSEDTGRAEPLVPPVPKKKKATASPSKTAPEPSAPATSSPAKETPEASAPTKDAPSPPPAAPAGKPVAAKVTAQHLAAVVTAATAPSSGSQSLVLHTGRAAVAASEKASAQLGRITELNRGEVGLGPLQEYAEKWNRADLSPATHGLGKDKLPVVDPSGLRSTAQHLSRLKHAVKEFDTAWHDASGNVVDQLVLEHRKALDAQEKISSELKDKLTQAELRHAQELKDAQAAAETKLDETLKEFTDASAVLRAELEEETRARKEAQDRIATLTTDQAEYDRLVMQADALALKLFPDSQPLAQKRVTERRVEQALSNPDAPWDPYDHLVALAARISHMRAVDRHLVELPERAMEIFKVLWHGEAVPANLTLLSDRLKDACRRIREWKCSAAHAGADAALRIACSWYEDLDLDAFHSLRGDAPTDKDPVLTAKRQDRAYRIAEFTHMRTFIPPPPGVRDEISDDEEEDVEDEEDEEAAEGDAPPEQGDAPPEAPEAGAQPPVA